MGFLSNVNICGGLRCSKKVEKRWVNRSSIGWSENSANVLFSNVTGR